MAIGGLARACSVLQSIPGAEQAEESRAAAIKAARFIRQELFDEKSGQMKRVFREGAGDAPAFADDYAFLIQGLIELYEATFDDQYLEFADTLQSKLLKCFIAAHNSEELIHCRNTNRPLPGPPARRFLCD